MIPPRFHEPDPPDDAFRDVDDLLRAGAPAEAPPSLVARMSASVLRRLRRRRLRARAAWGLASAAAAASLLALLLAPRTPPPADRTQDAVAGLPPARDESAVRIPGDAISLPSARIRARDAGSSRPARGGAETLSEILRELRSAEGSGSAGAAVRSRAVRALAARAPSRAAELFVRTALAWAPGDEEALSTFVSQTLPGLDPRAIRGIEAELGREIRAALRRPDRALEEMGERIDALAAALGASGVEEAWPPLSAILAEGGPRPSAIEACGALRDARAVPFLARSLLGFDRRSAEAARALGRIPDVRAVDALLAAHRMAMAFPGAFGPAEVERAREAVAEALRSRRDEAIAELCERLRGPRGSWDDVLALVDLFPQDAASAIEWIIFAAGGEARPILLKGLVEIGDSEAIAVLVRALEDARLARVARAHLIRLASIDLGPRPEAWRRWLAEPGTGGEDPFERRSS